MTDPIQLTEPQKAMIKNMGAFGYTPEMVVSVIGPQYKDYLLAALADPNSEESRIYKEGDALSEYHIDFKRFELARNGNMKAAKDLEIRKRKLKRQ